jgi:AraC-like DNA-binding protein
MDSQTASLSKIEFDTCSVDASQKLDYWIDKIEAFFDVPKPMHPAANHPYEGRLTLLHCNDVIFGEVHTHNTLYARSRKRINVDGLDHFMFQIFLEGGGPIEGGDVVQKGNLLVIDMGQPHQRESWPHNTLTFVIPRTYDLTLSRYLERLHQQILPATHPMVRFIFSQMHQLWCLQDDLSLMQMTQAISSTIGLLRDTLASDPILSNEGQFQQSSPALAHVLRSYIEDNLHRDLTVDELSIRFRISRAQLYRIFAPDGGVKTYIQHRRLQRCYRALLQKGQTTSVMAVAAAHGFKSESHFSRSFKAAFGESPSDLQNDASHRITYATGDRALIDRWLGGL